MKLTKSQLKQIIKEEIGHVLGEVLSAREEEMMSMAAHAAQFIKDELGVTMEEQEEFIEYLSNYMKQPEAIAAPVAG